MKKEIILLISLTLLLTHCDVKKEKNEFKEIEKISIHTQEIVSKLIDYGEITGPSEGELGKRPKQWNNYLEFRKNATDDELLLLTNHPNPVVKCYSFNILFYKRKKNCFKLIKDNLKDSSKVDISYGCVTNETQVNDYFIHNFTLPKLPEDGYYTYEQKNELDSLIIYTDDLVLNYKATLLENIAPKKSYYLKIKELALNGNNAAVVGLSKFNNSNDLEIINKLLKSEDSEAQIYGLKAVKNYTVNYFFESVKKIHQQEINKKKHFNYRINKALYKAIINYKNLASKKLIENSLKIKDSYLKKRHYELIWKALKGNPDKLYDGLIEKLNFTDYEIMSLNHSWSSDAEYFK